MKGIVNRFLLKFKKFLHQGVSPEKLAITIALGIVIGTFPVYGTTTIICIIVAFVFNLNHIAIQAANYGSYPIMLLCIIPLYRSGNAIFNTAAFNMEISELISMYQTNLLTTMNKLAWIIMSAVFLWLMLAPIAVLVLYWLIKPLIIKMSAPQ